MAGITSMPTGLIERIAASLDLKDLCSLRLSQPAFFPSTTSDRLKQLHPWNSAAYEECSGLQWHDPDDIDLGNCQTPCSEGFPGKFRLDAWCTTICKLSQHPTFRGWISSVTIMHRVIARNSSNLRLTSQGLGYAVSTFPCLDTLYLICTPEHGRSESEVDQFLDDFCASLSTPPLRHILIEDFGPDRTRLSTLILKVARTLKGMTLNGLTAYRGSWTGNIFPALRLCSLDHLCVYRPRIPYSPEGFCKLDVVDEDGNREPKKSSESIHVNHRQEDDYLSIEVKCNADYITLMDWLDKCTEVGNEKYKPVSVVSWKW